MWLVLPNLCYVPSGTPPPFAAEATPKIPELLLVRASGARQSYLRNSAAALPFILMASSPFRPNRPQPRRRLAVAHLAPPLRLPGR